MLVVGHVRRLAAEGGHRPDVALGFLAISPTGNAKPARRPLRLRGVIARDEPPLAVANRKNPELAQPGGAVGGTNYIFPRAKNLPAVGRPGRMIVVPCRRQPPDRLSGRSHHENAAALALRTKCDPFAVGGEGRLSVVLRAVFCQVANPPAADILPVDVPVARRAAGINQ